MQFQEVCWKGGHHSTGLFGLPVTQKTLSTLDKKVAYWARTQWLPWAGKHLVQQLPPDQFHWKVDGPGVQTVKTYSFTTNQTDIVITSAKKESDKDAKCGNIGDLQRKDTFLAWNKNKFRFLAQALTNWTQLFQSLSPKDMLVAHEALAQPALLARSLFFEMQSTQVEKHCKFVLFCKCTLKLIMGHQCSQESTVLYGVLYPPLG